MSKTPPLKQSVRVTEEEGQRGKLAGLRWVVVRERHPHEALGLLTASGPSSHTHIQRKGRKSTRPGALPLLMCRPALLPLHMRKCHPQTPRSHDWVTHQCLNETLDPPSLASGNLYYTQNESRASPSGVVPRGGTGRLEGPA